MSFAVIRDTRCFLDNGATAAHLFVSEDLSVGDIVGVLGVLGDPSVQGDIALSLEVNDKDVPVAISPYSKNLTLIKPLDKEGVEGPASVIINVICKRKHTLDPVRLFLNRFILSHIFLTCIEHQRNSISCSFNTVSILLDLAENHYRHS